MDINDVHRARNQAEADIKRADRVVRETAELCAGRLRKAGVYWRTLSELKNELKKFNMHTGKWKD